MIELKSLSVTIGNKKIIDSISFSAQPGENIAVLGPNGAGKTTLIRSIAGLTDFSGTLLVGGSDIRKLRHIDKGRMISYIPQGGDVDGWFTVRSFLELSRYPYRRPWEKISKEDIEIIEKSMMLTDCSEFAERELCTLSGGERQRVLIAGAIAQDCRIILLDEPGTYLDPVQRERIAGLISSIAKSQNRLVLTVTHEINEALNHSSRILAMAHGHLIFDSTPEIITETKVLKDVFKADFIKMTNPVTGKPIFLPGVGDER